MKHPSKRILALLLALALGLSVPGPAALAAALAEDSSAEVSVLEEDSVEENASAPAQDDAERSDEAPVSEDESEASASEDASVPEPEDDTADRSNVEEHPDASDGDESSAGEEQTGEVSEEDTPAQRKVLRSSVQLSRFLGQEWDDSYFQEAIVDPKKNRVTVDGHRSSVKDAFGPEADKEEILNSPQAAEEYFADTPYEAEANRDGTVTVTAPWQTCRIVVNAKTLEEDYGAETILEWPAYGQFILQFPDQESTRLAYESLSKRYECYVDQVLTAEESTQADSETWGAAYMGMDKPKANGTFSSGETIQVAVIDTGCSTDSSFFSGRSFSDKSRNIQNGSTDVSDVTGHGSHVAGIVHTCTPSNVELMILRVYSDSGTATLLTVDNAIKYAVENGAEVVNISLAEISSTTSTTHLADQSLRLAKETGIPVVCAAGNKSQNVANTYPACNPDTIAVSAITRSGAFAATLSDPPDQSNIGSGNTGSAYGSGIDFCAPGIGVVSANYKGGTSTKSGTSMSSPHVAAAFAWLRLEDASATVDQLYARMKELCVDLGDPGKDDYFGWGCPNLSALGSSGHQHQWQTTVVEPTCTEEGYTLYSCSCGQQQRRDVVSPTHLLDANGKCSRCGRSAQISFDNGLSWSYDSRGKTLTISGKGTLTSRPWETLYAPKYIHWLVLDGVTAVGDKVFQNYTSLEGVTLGKFSSDGTLESSLTRIGSKAFYGCTALEELLMPKSLTELGDGAFGGCTALKHIDLDSSSGAFSVVERTFLYNQDKTELLACAAASASESLNVAKTVKTIRPWAAEGCKNLNKLILPTGLETLGSGAFANCSGLKEIYARSSGTALGTNAFSGVTASLYVSKGCSGWDSLSALGGTLTRKSYVGDLSQWTMRLNSETWTYTGVALRPGVILTDGTNVVYNYNSPNQGIAANHQDVFSASYTNNVDPAFAAETDTPPTATVTGKGIYYGTNTATFSILLTTPQVPTLSNTPQGISVTWNSVKNASLYQVMRKDDTDDWAAVSKPTSDTSFTDTTAASGTQYSYSVRCVNEAGKPISKYSPVGTTVFCLAAPPLTALSLQDEGILFRWESVTGAARYQVLRQTSGSSWQVLGESTSNSFESVGFVVQTGDQCTVRAIAQDGTESGLQAGITARFLAAPVLSSADCEGTGVRVRWSEAEGAVRYRVLCKSSSGAWKPVGDTSDTSLLVKTSDGSTPLQSDTTYSFSVRCISADGASCLSAYDTTGISVHYLAPPVLEEVEQTDDGAALRWNAVTGAARYQVLRQASDGSWETIGETQSCGYLDTAPAPAHGQWYALRSVAQDGRVSGQGDACTLSPVLLSTYCEGTGVRVKWNAVTGAAKYQVLCKTGSGAWQTVGETADTSLLVKTSDGTAALRNNTLYTFTVRCLSADGENPASGYDSDGLSVRFLSAPVLSSAANEGSGVRVKWKAVSGAAKYQVLCKIGTGAWKAVGSTTGTSFLAKTSDGKTTLVTGKSCRFSVRCLSAKGEKSGYNETGKAVVFVGAPTLSSVQNAKGKKLTAKWKKVSGVTGYQVQYALNKSFSGAKTASASGAGKTGVTLSKLTKNKTYWVRVRSWKTVSGKKQWSSWSAAKSVKIKK